jgi:hypothetical protein
VGAGDGVTDGGAEVGLGAIRLGVALWAGVNAVGSCGTAVAGELQAPREAARIRMLESTSGARRGRGRVCERKGDP